MAKRGRARSDDRPAPLAVVGLGASAGGLEALERFLRATPAETGLAFVVVTHRARTQDHVLDDILTRYTQIPIVAAQDEQPVEPDRIFVMPPRGVLTLAGGRLRLTEAGARREFHPVDVFFGSLAEDLGERAIGIVLSGSGSDGALGIKAIKQRGGLTLAQGSNATAPSHPGMPGSAIATGMVDLVLPAEDMPERLLAYVKGFGLVADLIAKPAGSAAERATQARQAICAILRRQVGHDFTGYKANTFFRRVQRRMQLLQLAELDAYLDRLGTDTDEVVQLFRDLLIGVTGFFRDGDAFDALQEQVPPALFAGRGADDTIRVWVPGCSTGEEAYSLAMLLSEHARSRQDPPRVQIFATDIDDAALAIGRAGRYPAALLDAVSPEQRRRFFTHEDTVYTITKDIRELCTFSNHSVIRDAPFSRIDLISCRNLLIYLNADMQTRVMPVLHYALRRGGFLFLGLSENITQFAELFEPVDKKQRIFRRSEPPRASVRPPLFLPTARPATEAGAVRLTGTPSALTLRQRVEGRVLDRFAPAHVVVNREGEVVYYSARTGKYLEAAAGVPNRQIVALARRGLRLELRGALGEAVQTGRPVAREGVSVEFDGRTQVTGLEIEPLPDGDNDPLFLILFHDRGAPLGTEETATRAHAEADSKADVEHLERELRDTRERLQTTVEEYETALEELKSTNEELLSVNEELQSTNEELETSKEEIQSVNEELHTMNLELNSKLHQLDLANNDLKNLFDGTDLAMIFLDFDLTIRTFTPAAMRIFRLIAGDLGRPLRDIAAEVVYPELGNDIALVLGEARPFERRVRRQDGSTQYLARVVPYRDSQGKVDGVLLTFVDVTRLTEAEEHQRALVAELNHRVRNMLTIVIGLARLSLRGAPDHDLAVEVYIQRLRSLAGTFELLSRENWTRIVLADLVRRELKPFALHGTERLTIEGPPVSLDPTVALPFGMALHELATNAAKYGALSVPDGRVAVHWALEDRDGRSRLVFGWQEQGGPPVRAPERRGFGSRVIEEQMRHGIDGHAQLDFRPTGLVAELVVPAGPLTGIRHGQVR